MRRAESTCWSVIQSAATGQGAEREEFVRRYAPVMRAYLGSRWRESPCRHDLEDALQEVFLECFRRGGALERVERDRSGGFRAFLYGVVRNVARRFESRRARRRELPAPGGFDLDEREGAGETQSRLFDREWIRSILEEAATLLERQARERGPQAERRVQILDLRFGHQLPIREIARRFHCDAAFLHHQYAQARDEYRSALIEVMGFHHPGSPGEVEGYCVELLDALE